MIVSEIPLPLDKKHFLRFIVMGVVISFDIHGQKPSNGYDGFRL
jgi:hypothetical protein